jgi:hypothetical protein
VSDARDIAYHDQVFAALDAAIEIAEVFDAAISSERDIDFRSNGDALSDVMIRRVPDMRACPHIAAMRSPMPAVAFLNRNTLTCEACTMRWLPVLRVPVDDKCDFCGLVPADDWFHAVTGHIGLVVFIGHSCNACHEKARESAG